ncbi:MAG TPA: PBP1A family penicillin-binding protein [Gaiellaceae bacterium]|nr:PBP1A family penicillin-binding protein [Gaiellaceae bacterium]
MLGLVGSASFAFGLVTAIAGEIPKLDPANYKPGKNARNSYIYTSDGRVLAVLRPSEARIVVKSEEISDVMKQAIVAIEDRRFFEHRGLDLRGIARAVWQDLRNRAVVEGGSTITQQFVKNAYVKSSRSFERKLKEAALAWQLEQQWSKDRILTAYLNTIYFGNGAYGIEQASRVYFKHRASKLTLAESALLAGIPADPTRYDPRANPRQAKARRHTVLRAMLEQGDITRVEYWRADHVPMPDPEDIRLPGVQGPAPYFTNYVKQQLIDAYGTARVFDRGLRVRTSIDLDLQQVARDAIAKWLPDDEGPSAALVAIDPRDGRVLAMYGGRNFAESQFNLAVQGERQPGSAFKPFALAAALEQGISPTTSFVSAPVTISLGDRLWRVENYEGSNLGTIDLETATTYSDNTVYAQLTELVRPQAVARMAKKLGIQSPIQGYFSVTLGGEAVNPLDMARAYATIANGGQRVDGALMRNVPRAVLSVNEKTNFPVPHAVLGANESAIVNRLLQGVVESGTGKRAQLADGRPVAGKTGTTENYGDAWFVGYTPQLAVAVWVGYPDRLRPMLEEYHGSPVAGGTFPALIFKSFMEKALPHLEAEPEAFPSPSYPYASPRSVVFRDGRWRADNGYCRGTREVQYFTGTGPATEANCLPNEVDVPRVLGLTYEQAVERLALQPLEAEPLFKPAVPKQRVGIVIGQLPKVGARLSSYDTVQLIVAKPVFGVVPNVVGLPLAKARKRLEDRQLRVTVSYRPAAGKPGRVVLQKPNGGVAAAPRMLVTVVVSAPAG